MNETKNHFLITFIQKKINQEIMKRKDEVK